MAARRRSYSFIGTPSPHIDTFEKAYFSPPPPHLKSAWEPPSPILNTNRRSKRSLLSWLAFIVTCGGLWHYGQSMSESVNVCATNTQACAYATFLCDDVLLPAARVLVHSINQTRTPHPIILMALPEVSDDAVEQVEYLGAQIIRVEPLPYPFADMVKFELGINKQCRYTKLRSKLFTITLFLFRTHSMLSWNFAVFGLSQFKRITYLDIDTMVVKNIDEHFSSPTDLAGVPDVGSVLNTGVMVIKPSDRLLNEMKTIYFDAPSYNRGDQGFINWFFTNHTKYSVSHLPPTMNVPAKLNSFAVGKAIIKDASVVHLTSEVKPWSFHVYYHPQWASNYHATMFAAWRRADDFVNSELQLANLSHLHYRLDRSLHNPPAEERVLNARSLDDEAHQVRLSLHKYTWRNSDRSGDICENYTPRFELSSFPEQDLYSVSLSFYSEERLPTLELLVKHYLRSLFVHKVYITWHSPSIAPTSMLKALQSEKQLEIIMQDSDSLNNRFNPIRTLRTQAVLIADDDIFVPIEDVDFAFQVWKNRKDSLVGFFPRIHGYREDGSLYYEMAGVYHNYTVGFCPQQSYYSPKCLGTFTDDFDQNHVLERKLVENFLVYQSISKAANVFIQVYTPTLVFCPQNFTTRNCEDVLMNMMIAGLTASKPVCVASDRVHDLGTFNGISTVSDHVTARDTCTQDLIALFGRDTLAPVVNTEMVTRFHKNSFKKTAFEDLAQLLLDDGLELDA